MLLIFVCMLPGWPKSLDSALLKAFLMIAYCPLPPPPPSLRPRPALLTMPPFASIWVGAPQLGGSGEVHRRRQRGDGPVPEEGGARKGHARRGVPGTARRRQPGETPVVCVDLFRSGVALLCSVASNALLLSVYITYGGPTETTCAETTCASCSRVSRKSVTLGFTTLIYL